MRALVCYDISRLDQPTIDSEPVKTLTLDQALFVIAGRPDLAHSRRTGRPALSGWVIGQIPLGDSDSLSTSSEIAAKAEAKFLELVRTGKLTVLDEVDGDIRNMDPRWFEDAALHYGGPPDFAVTLRRTDWVGSKNYTEGGALWTSHPVRGIAPRVDADHLNDVLNPKAAGKVPLLIERFKVMFPGGVPPKSQEPRQSLASKLISTTPALNKSLDQATLKKAIETYNASLAKKPT
jgi:hypothetical protein